MPLLRSFIDWQRRLSRRFDELLPASLTTDGNRDFLDRFSLAFLAPGLRVYDVGGGKHPWLDAASKADRSIVVVGLDIDARELAQAPAGGYDETLCADITRYEGRGDADLVVCQSLLEHLPDNDRAFHALSSMLKPGGRALIFVPSRNALFARLNLLLPQALKRRLLFAIYPESRAGQGFASFYHRCTPRDFEALAARHGLLVRETRLYFQSAYFTFFAPLHVAWRLWSLAFRALRGAQAAETFCMALEKPRAR